MATNALPGSNQLRRSARLASTDAAEPDILEPNAKRQKTSTVESDNNVTFTHSTTLDRPLFDGEYMAINREVIVIKDEDGLHTEETLVAKEVQDVETCQPSNRNETPPNHPATLSTMEALELAEKSVDEYAGPYTKELEKKLKDFEGVSLA